MAEMKTLTLNDVQYDVVDATAVKFVKQTLTEEQKAQARENIGAIKTIDGASGQVLGFDSVGNPIPVSILEATTETTPRNLFNASVGYTEGYTSPAGPINLNTLEVPLDTPTSGSASAYKLHNELIYLKPNTTYAISLFTGNATLFRADTGTRSGYLTPGGSSLIKGDNCYLYTTGDISAGYYLAIHLHIASQTAYEDMIICEGDTLYADTPILPSEKYLHNSIKVKAEQIEGLDNTNSGNGENNSNGTLSITGSAGDVVGFDSDGNIALMSLFDDITEIEKIPGNLFDASVGYTAGYATPAGPINLETLEVPLDKADSAANLLHNELIYLEPNTTYAISKFIGGITLFNGANGSRSMYCVPPSTGLTEGDNCYLLTTLDRDYCFYMAISIHSTSSPTAYADMVIVKGNNIPTEKITTVIGTRLNDNIKINAEQVEGLEDMIPESSGGNDATTPSSDFDALYAVARKIQNYQSPTTLTCSLMSDTHYSDDGYKPEEALKTARTMGLMESYMKQDFIGNLGDMIPGDVGVETSRMHLVKLAQATNQNAKCPVFYARGNHDDNGWYSGGGKGGTYKTNEMLNDAEWYQAVFGISAKDLVIDSTRPNGGYGYFDHEASKIRVFILNTEDLPYIVKDDGSYRYSSYNGHAFSNEQLNFVANALYFEDKDTPNDWAALFMSHVPLDTTNDDGYRFGIKDALIRGHEYMLAIIAAYRKGAAFKASGSTYNSSMGDVSADFNVSVDVDYTTKGGGDVIAFVSGHTHTDNFSSLVGTEGSLSRGYAYIGLMGSTQFANFVFDRENSRICSVKYGTSIPDTTEGAAVEAPDTGSIESGEWTVNIDQFRPNGENLYNGLSETHTSGGLGSATKINTSTLELDAVAAGSGYIPTKAIFLKPFTRYAIPSSWNGQLLAFGLAGGKSGYLTPTAADGYKYFQTGIRQYYVVFAHHTGSYTDYANFWIKEMGEGVEYA